MLRVSVLLRGSQVLVDREGVLLTSIGWQTIMREIRKTKRITVGTIPREGENRGEEGNKGRKKSKLNSNTNSCRVLS